MFRRLSFFSIIRELPDPLLFKILFRLSRSTPRTSSPDSNWEKELLGNVNLTRETFAGSMAVIFNPDSLNFILTSVTRSEIISIILHKINGFSSLTSIFKKNTFYF